MFIVTGIFPLVPGAGIYHTAYALVSRNMEAFTLRGMQTLALAGAIALGILIGMGFPKLLVELGGHALESAALPSGGAPMTTLTDDFAYEVLSVVAEIPGGRVATYGQIARLVGKEKNARLVAKILSRAEYYGHFPCHRVVNHAGRLAPHWPEQAFLLFWEGVSGFEARRMRRFKSSWINSLRKPNKVSIPIL